MRGWSSLTSGHLDLSSSSLENAWTSHYKDDRGHAFIIQVIGQNKVLGQIVRAYFHERLIRPLISGSQQERSWDRQKRPALCCRCFQAQRAPLSGEDPLHQAPPVRDCPQLHRVSTGSSNECWPITMNSGCTSWADHHLLMVFNPHSRWDFLIRI